METQKPKCCVRDCDSRDTREYRGRGRDNHGRSATFIVRLCNTCKDGIQAKKVHYTFSHAESLVFVAEIFEEHQE